MAITKTTISNPLGTTLIIDTIADATSEDGMYGQAGKIYAVEIDNTSNSHVTYVKLAQVASATVGTTAPHWLLPVPGSAKITYVIGTGLYFETDLTLWAVQESATTGTTAPDSSVTVKILAT